MASQPNAAATVTPAAPKPAVPAAPAPVGATDASQASKPISVKPAGIAAGKTGPAATSLAGMAIRSGTGPPVKSTNPAAPRPQATTGAPGTSGSSVLKVPSSGTVQPSVRVPMAGRPGIITVKGSATDGPGLPQSPTTAGTGTTVLLGRSAPVPSSACPPQRVTASPVASAAEPAPVLLKVEKSLVSQKTVPRTSLQKTSESSIPEPVPEIVPLKGGRMSVAGIKRKRADTDPRGHVPCVVFPPPLKAALVRDRMFIVQQHKLLKAPEMCGRPTITAILHEFAQSVPANQDKALTLYFNEGLKLMFNANLDRCLLYAGEAKLQLDGHGEVPKNKKTPKRSLDDTSWLADVYGGVHLLRLLLKVPSLIQQYNAYNRGGRLEAPGADFLQRKLDSLMQFLTLKAEKILPNKDDYE